MLYFLREGRRICFYGICNAQKGEVNRKYSEIWPNISEKKEAPKDAEKWQGVEDKYNKYFSKNPGR